MPTSNHSHTPAALRTRGIALLPVIALLGGCNATMTPLPAVPDADRRPVNSAAAIELQSCRSEVNTLRLGLLEARQAAPRTAHCTSPARDVPEPPALTRRVVLTFERGQSRIELDDALREALREAAEGAELILVQGRSDAAQESAAETQIARRRAESAAAALVQAGVPASRMRVSWLGVADQNSETDQRRRVELDFVQRAPVLLLARAATPPASPTAPVEATRPIPGRETAVPSPALLPGAASSAMAQTTAPPTQRALLKR